MRKADMELSEVKRNLNKTVLWEGDKYLLRSCVLYFDTISREHKYSAELVSLKANCIVRAPLERVEAYGNT